MNSFITSLFSKDVTDIQVQILNVQKCLLYRVYIPDVNRTGFLNFGMIDTLDKIGFCGRGLFFPL